jgi:DNA-binding HxlR family transcriptional regulator
VRAAGPVLRPKSFSRQEAQKADGRYLVLWALRHGARTQREMRRLIRMHLVVSGHESLSDVITDGLAELMLDERVVRCVGFAGGERAYALEFLKAS